MRRSCLAIVYPIHVRYFNDKMPGRFDGSKEISRPCLSVPRGQDSEHVMGEKGIGSIAKTLSGRSSFG